MLVDPGNLGAGQAGEEGGDGRGQLLRGVQREGRVVASLGLRHEPLRCARARMAEGTGASEHEPAGLADGRAQRPLAVQALLVLDEAREVAAPDRPRVLLRSPGVDEQLAVVSYYACGVRQEAAPVPALRSADRSRPRRRPRANAPWPPCPT